VEISSKWEHGTGPFETASPAEYAYSTAEIDLDSEGVLEITAGDALLSIRNPRTQRTYLTHVQAREAAVLLLEAVALYRDSNDMDVDEGIAAALIALRELAPGTVTA
jgi:hypothetical protein